LILLLRASIYESPKGQTLSLVSTFPSPILNPSLYKYPKKKSKERLKEKSKATKNENRKQRQIREESKGQQR